MDIAYLLHQTLFGAIAAAGFGVLFNVGFRTLPWCAASGALAIAVRTLALQRGSSLVAASFLAALAVGAGVQFIRSRIGISRSALEVVGCIPMIPGGVATKAILGLLAASRAVPASAHQTFVIAIENTLRVTFIIGALGTGLAIPTFVLRVRRPH